MPEPVRIDVNALPVSNPDDIRPVYTNNANVMIAPWDVRIIFTEFVSTGSGNQALELRANIVMNPAHAKALAGALVSTIQAFEDQFGPIQMPKGIISNINEAAAGEKR